MFSTRLFSDFSKPEKNCEKKIPTNVNKIFKLAQFSLVTRIKKREKLISS